MYKEEDNNFFTLGLITIAFVLLGFNFFMIAQDDKASLTPTSAHVTKLYICPTPVSWNEYFSNFGTGFSQPEAEAQFDANLTSFGREECERAEGNHCASVVFCKQGPPGFVNAQAIGEVKCEEIFPKFVKTKGPEDKPPSYWRCDGPAKATCDATCKSKGSASL